MLNKPRGYISTCLPSRERGKSVLELIPHDRRYFPVGRLDRDTTGLLLLTDDGELAYHLTHPKHGARKVYVVRTAALLTDTQLEQLHSGVFIEGVLARAVEVTRLDRNRIQIVLNEGRKRQIRRMIMEVGSEVVELHRTEIAGLSLGNLQPGEWRELDYTEIESLRIQK
jgi:pseudouridine synthase